MTHYQNSRLLVPMSAEGPRLSLGFSALRVSGLFNRLGGRGGLV